MNRRAFLLGAGAATFAGVAASAVALAGRQHLGQGSPGTPGTAGSPGGHAPVRGPVEVSGSLDSRYTGARMGWTISVPGQGERPRAIVYCLHAMGGNHRMAFDSIRVPEVAQRLGLSLAVAAVDGGPDSYWHRRADGSDALTMLLREFIPLVRNRVGSLPQALLGWSMGGYGALLAAERAPARFRAVAAVSPALWLAPGETAPGAFDSPADFYANDVFTGASQLRSMHVALFCGTADPFYLATRHLSAVMTFPHEERFGPGAHEPAYWRRVAAPALRAIGKAPGIGSG